VVANPTAQRLPFGAFAFSSMQSFRFNLTFRESPTTSIVYLDLSVKRPPTTKGFAIFVVIVMWLLTLGVMVATFQVVFRQREVAPPLIGVLVALLFALPAVRNTQPAAPPIGTLLDTVSLFWNMMLVALCAITLMITWVFQGPRPEAPKSPFMMERGGGGIGGGGNGPDVRRRPGPGNPFAT